MKTESERKVRPYTVLMREIPGQDQAECVMAIPGPPFSKVLPTALEYEMVQKYAASLDAETCFYSERRPKDSELVCIVATYRSGRKDGGGRMGSTFKRWVIFKAALKLAGKEGE